MEKTFTNLHQVFFNNISQNMKILFLSNFFPPSRSWGYTQLCHDVFESLQHRGHDVAVLTSNYESNPVLGSEKKIFRSLYLESDPQFYSPTSFLVKRRWEQRRNLESLRTALRDYSPDILFVWGMWNLSKNILAFAEALDDVKVVYYLSDHWPTIPNPHEVFWHLPARHWYMRPIKNILNQIVLSFMEHDTKTLPLKFRNAMCVSYFLRESLVEKGIPVQNAKVVHNGIGANFFNQEYSGNFHKQNDGFVRLVYAGRLEFGKGVHTAIKSIAHLRRHYGIENVKLSILGSGHPDYERFLNKLVADNNLTNQVNFLGRAPREHLPELLKQYNALLFPSIVDEALPRMPQEAMACGLVVIGTTSGGTRELLVDEETGLTFTPEDSEGLANQISRLISDPKLRDRLSKNGYETVKEFYNLNKMVDEIEHYLFAVLKDSNVGLSTIDNSP